MQSTVPSPEQLLEARTARNVSIKTAAAEMGIDFTWLNRLNRGIAPRQDIADTIKDWIAKQPPLVPIGLPGEAWRDVVDWEGLYEVSSLGRVRSVARMVEHPYSGEVHVRSRVLSQNPSPKSGHRMVMLAKGGRDGTRRTQNVHLLVLSAFKGPRPAGLHGCHNDGNSANNRLDNLRWDTPTENMLDRVWHETNPGVVRPEVAARLAEQEQER